MLLPYIIITTISFISFILFIIISDKKVLFYNASFFIFALIANIGYLFIAISKNVDEAIIANKITYISGCLLSVALLMLVFDACKVELPKPVRFVLFAFNMTVLFFALTAGQTDWFYKKCHLETINGVTKLVKEYGPAHNLFLIMLYGYPLIGICLLVYSLIKRKKLIYKNVILLLLQYLMTVFCYTIGRKIFNGIEPVCISYCFSDIFLLFITYNTSLYNLDEALLNSIEKQDHQGFILFDKKFRYAGCNNVAIKYIPVLDTQILTKNFDTNIDILYKIENLVRNYNGCNDKLNFVSKGLDLELSVQYLYKNNKIRGYIVRIIDDSKLQSFIRELDYISKNKSNFLSNVSHEIRTPINSILGMNEMILRECNDDTIHEYASNIKSAGQTLLELINDILDLSKIEAGKLDVIPMEYELYDVIHELDSMIRPLIKDNKLVFNINTSQNLPKKLYGDSVRLKQMLINLLTNAVKYTDKGSVTLDISGEQSDENFVFNFSVIDTGKGIKTEDKKHLFNAFERVDELKNSGIEGTGLGLAITNKFAQMMDGDIEVKSEYGNGSTFILTIPQKIIGNELMGDYSPHSKSFIPHKEYKESFKAQDATILVVDDVLLNLKVIELLLKETGLDIQCCTSGKECIEAVKNHNFDVIFLDHMMPELDGVDILNIIRENHYCDDTPIIALTANVGIDAQDIYLNYGFNDYISKPVQPKILEEMLIKYLPEKKLKIE